jgi:hypothetical protein
LQPLAKPVAVVPAPLPPGVAEPVSPAEPAVDVQADNKPAPTPPKAQEGVRGRRVWTWVAGGSAVVFAGTAVIFGVSMQSKFDSLNKSCGSASNSSTACTQSDIDSVLLRRNLANVSWGLAAAAAATAGVLFFVEGRSVSVAPMAGEATGFVARMAY